MEWNQFNLIPCVELENLDVLNDKQLFKEAMYLSESRSKIFIDYFTKVRKCRYGYMGVLPAEYASEYHKIKNEWKRKIITIGIGDDLVICVLKHIQMFQHIYKRLEGLPISINNNRENEEIVFDKLSNTGLCKKFLVNEPESKLLDKKGYKLHTSFEIYEVCSNVKTNYEKISSNKWRTKKGINRLFKDKKLTWTKLDKPNNSIEKLNNAFLKWKKDIEKSKWTAAGFAKSINQYKYWEDPNIDYWLFEYDNFPIGLMVYLRVNDEIGFQLVNKGIAEWFNLPHTPFNLF